MNRSAIKKLLVFIVLGVLPFIVSTGVGSMAYFHYGDPKYTCASCHEMDSVHSDWSASAHSTLHCRNCHGGSLTLDAHALTAHVNRVVQHFTGDLTKDIHLTEPDLLRVHVSCRDCHPNTFAQWESSGHACNYADVFLNAAHNQMEHPADDCFRCHGMFFHGPIENLMTPIDKTGPWTFKDAAKAEQPAIPCLACHQIHTPSGEEVTSKAHFYDNRERLYFPCTGLPSLSMTDDGREIRVSPDPRQRLCTQCHAPSNFHAHHLGSSDDRTPTGVHEGLSCLDCHDPHSNRATASCSTCHPASSHCGLDVEKMDTTFADPTSKHDIHTVACSDCHEGERPTRSVKGDGG